MMRSSNEAGSWTQLEYEHLVCVAGHSLVIERASRTYCTYHVVNHQN